MRPDDLIILATLVICVLIAGAAYVAEEDR